MTKNKACRLLNEALAGRFITEVGCEGVVDQSLGELFMPYLEVGLFLKVIIGYAFSTASQAEEIGELLRSRLEGRRVLERAVGTLQFRSGMLVRSTSMAHVS